MNRRLDDLLLRRGRLIERIAGQREAISRDFAPIGAALGKVDLAAAGVRSGLAYLHRHALAASALVGALLIFRGKGTWPWVKRAFSLWRSWRALHRSFARSP
jgi:hypothetical protein